MNTITPKEKTNAENFIIELNQLFDKYNLVIDCHGDFVGYLYNRNTKRMIATLYEDCEPDYYE